MRNSSRLLIPLSFLLAAPGALAEDASGPGVPSDATPAPIAENAEPLPGAAPSATTSDDKETPPQPPGPPSTIPSEDRETPAAPKPGSSLRPALTLVASEARLRRYGEGALSLTASGALFGVGFTAKGSDMTWSHVLWVASGIAALGGVVTLLVPSEVESLECRGRALSEEGLERRWQALARQAKVQRRTGAVLGGLLGAASIALGVLAFEGELGTLTDDQRLILGSVLVTGGALGITKGAVEWFVPTPVETGFALASSRPRLSLSGAPSPNGFHVSMTGAF